MSAGAQEEYTQETSVFDQTVTSSKRDDREYMANKRKLAKKAKLKKNKDRLVLYHASNNKVESSASESFSGESIDGRHNEIIQEENDEDDDEMDIKVKRTISVSPHYHS